MEFLMFLIKCRIVFDAKLNGLWFDPRSNLLACQSKMPFHPNLLLTTILAM